MAPKRRLLELGIGRLAGVKLTLSPNIAQRLHRLKNDLPPPNSERGGSLPARH